MRSIPADPSLRGRPGDAMIQYLIDSMVELRFQAFLADLPDPMLGTDRRGIVRFVNGQAERLFGRPRSELLGSPADDLLYDPLNRTRVSAWHRPLEDPHAVTSGIELMANRVGGDDVPVEVTLSLVGTQDGLWVIAAIRDVADRKRAEEALKASEEAIRAARDAALQTSRLKSQFLANMSHEIRTPMNGVLGLTHLLLETDLNPIQRRYMLALRDSGLNLLAIINDILDFSKVEAGKLALDPVDFDLRAMAESVMSLLSSSARDKRLFFSLEVSPAVPRRVHGDSGRLRQVLTNLAGNAVKFTDAGSVIIRIGPAPGPGSPPGAASEPEDPNRLRFEVIDTGIGIADEARPYLLDPFTQADASTTRRFGGTGLGLAICCQLVGLMGGSLDYESALGQGSRFWFEVTLPPAAEPVAGPGRSGLSVVRGSATGTPAGKAALPGARALVVDDSPVNRLVAREMLESLGFSVDVAGSGAEAVEATTAGNYSIVLMDCLMPDMDGYEATARIRDRERGPEADLGKSRHTPIVAITASVMPGDREKCLKAGMDDYLAKPLEPAALAEVVGRYQPQGEGLGGRAGSDTGALS